MQIYLEEKNSLFQLLMSRKELKRIVTSFIQTIFRRKSIDFCELYPLMSRFKEMSSKIEGRFDRKSVSLSQIDYVFVKN